MANANEVCCKNRTLESKCREVYLTCFGVYFSDTWDLFLKKKIKRRKKNERKKKEDEQGTFGWEILRKKKVDSQLNSIC
jgi:hypothetical protein